MNDICQNICPCNQCNTEPEDCELAKAYQKQIAKKPKPDRDKFSYYCPRCSKEISDSGWYPDDGFCPYCGQAISPEETKPNNTIEFKSKQSETAVDDN